MQNALKWVQDYLYTHMRSSWLGLGLYQSQDLYQSLYQSPKVSLDIGAHPSPVARSFFSISVIGGWPPWVLVLSGVMHDIDCPMRAGPGGGRSYFFNIRLALGWPPLYIWPPRGHCDLYTRESGDVASSAHKSKHGHFEEGATHRVDRVPGFLSGRPNCPPAPSHAKECGPHRLRESGEPIRMKGQILWYSSYKYNPSRGNSSDSNTWQGAALIWDNV